MAVFGFYSRYNGLYECQIEFSFEHVDQILCQYDNYDKLND